MRNFKCNVIWLFFNNLLVDLPTPININYWWNIGSLLGLVLFIQIFSGIFLAMHYIPQIDLAFYSVEHIMRDVFYGWWIRYLHANFASIFFGLIYLHIGRGIYYGSYLKPRTSLWSVGVIIYILLVCIAFLGYVLPMGQMSLWGATVITSMLSVIPVFGSDVLTWIWGGFSVDQPTLNRLFSFHFFLPFVLIGLVFIHIILLHETGSSNPIGCESSVDLILFHHSFTVKDLLGVSILVWLGSFIIFYEPNVLGHSDNYIMANSLVTPNHIVPEWYVLPFYALLRAIPHKLLGIVGMLCGMLVLLLLPYLDLSCIRGFYMSPICKFVFWLFVFNFILLGWLGGQVVEYPFVVLSQLACSWYFLYFLVLMPIFSWLNKSLIWCR